MYSDIFTITSRKSVVRGPLNLKLLFHACGPECAEGVAEGMLGSIEPDVAFDDILSRNG